ncbi:hypothetical protein CYMTET_20285 [Cymbomonas tetramitiformis]|uniref:Apple domain-containing protein n=1 Tax=Cymbomonas tetramitiformis TaxID=36881 RepID=A0AAE0G4D3_9CHLO|nr:hypothetical protein CYMTET_20285 [Cymbomonas tetramitiformis]
MVEFLVRTAKNTSELECVSQDHTEYWGDVVFWGAEHLQATPEACCEACAAHARKGNWGPGQKECNTWVWCANPSGCGDRKHKECWLKHQPNPARFRRLSLDKAAAAPNRELFSMAGLHVLSRCNASPQLGNKFLATADVDEA